MIDNDELLLEQFFQQAREVQLPDDGFSRRVINRLPERAMRQSRLWTAVCVAVSLVLFTLVGGWQILLGWCLKVMTVVPTTEQLVQLWLSLLVVSVIVVSELLRRERIRLLV